MPGASDVAVYEEQYTGPRGPSGARIVVGTVNEILFAMVFGADGEMWSWDEVISIAALQVQRFGEFFRTGQRAERRAGTKVPS